MAVDAREEEDMNDIVCIVAAYDGMSVGT